MGAQSSLGAAWYTSRSAGQAGGTMATKDSAAWGIGRGGRPSGVKPGGLRAGKAERAAEKGGPACRPHPRPGPE